MTDLWTDTPPADFNLRVGRLVTGAKRLGIKVNLRVKYARLVIAAEEVVANREKGERETREEVARLAAWQHGIYENDPAKAKARYQAARRAQQELHNSAKGLAARLDGFEKVLRKRHELVDREVADRFPKASLIAASNLIKEFATASTPRADNLLAYKSAKSPLSLTKEGHAFQWWHLQMPEYAGKWEHMYALARCWHLTDAKDVATFRRGVQKQPREKTLQARTFILGCPPWATP